MGSYWTTVKNGTERIAKDYHTSNLSKANMNVMNASFHFHVIQKRGENWSVIDHDLPFYFINFREYNLSL